MTLPKDTYIIDTTKSKNATLRPIALQNIRLADTFWEPRREKNRTVTLRTQYEKLEESKCLDNFRRASGRKKEIDFIGWYFADSDLYKWIEAVSASLATHHDADLEAKLESTIDELSVAQQPDGYLNTYFMFEKEKDRWTDLHVLHEMYCAGHLFQAAVMHHRATGKTNLLTVAEKLANHINTLFGPDGKPGACGHPEAELALVELYRATGNASYLTLAERMILARGQEPTAVYGMPNGNRRYLQDHVPYVELKEVTGHAVRMLYLAAGAADVTLEKDAPDLLSAQDAQWENFTQRRMYVTGAAGARHEGESFGADYELPNDRAYAETCAAVASVMWNQRLLLQTGDAKYADLIEHTLYNAVLPGISLSGTEYFYVNPLENDGTHRRQPWFGCACCPPNIARLLAQLPSYVASLDDEKTVWIHQFIAGEIETEQGIIKVETSYPWEGNVTLTNTGDTPISLKIRVPAWAGYVSYGGEIRVGGATIDGALVMPRAYYHVTLIPNATTTLEMPLQTRYIRAHQFVTNLTGRFAVHRGPLVYCLETIDYSLMDVRGYLLPNSPKSFIPTVIPSDYPLANMVVLTTPMDGRVPLEGSGTHTNDCLKTLYGEGGFTGPLPLPATLIPYFAWANREAGRMQIWMRQNT
jgi:uncharacterized protein